MIKLPTELLLEHFTKSQQIEAKTCPCDPQGQDEVLKLSKLKVLASSDERTYSGSFVANYLLIKINNFLTYGEKELSHFVVHLAMFYNNFVGKGCLEVFKQGSSDQ